jgi:hypothetical protein
MKTIYCTVMSRPFVPRALALQESIARHSPTAQFAFFCTDDAVADFLRALDLKRAHIFAPIEFETRELLAVKPSLSQGEYCWTCKSVALFHVFGRFSDLDWAVWVDSDMYAFDDPDKALLAYPDADVLLTPHRFAWAEIAAMEPVVGRFNAGYAAFRNNPGGHEVLRWWQARCLESCSTKPGSDTYADQKYLERIPGRFAKIAESELPGLNCAPWNIIGQPVTRDAGCVAVSGAPLLLYHFQGFRVMRAWAFDFYAAKVALPKVVKDEIYWPYAKALMAQTRNVARPASFGIDTGFSGLRGWLRLGRRVMTHPNVALNPSGAW